MYFRGNPKEAEIIWLLTENYSLRSGKNFVGAKLIKGNWLGRLEKKRGDDCFVNFASGLTASGNTGLI